MLKYERVLERGFLHLWKEQLKAGRAGVGKVPCTMEHMSTNLESYVGSQPYISLAVST